MPRKSPKNKITGLKTHPKSQKHTAKDVVKQKEPKEIEKLEPKAVPRPRPGTPNQPEAEPVKFKKSQDLKQLKIIVAILIIMIAGFAAFDYIQKSGDEETVDTSEYTTAPPRTVFDTTGWADYQNEIYNFTFKVPPEWEGYATTKGQRRVGEGELEWSYNYFHYEFPKVLSTDEEDETGAVYFEIGVFSPANWENAKADWTLLGQYNNVFFGGRASDEDIATGLTERWEETEGVFQTFELGKTDKNAEEQSASPPQLEESSAGAVDLQKPTLLYAVKEAKHVTVYSEAFPGGDSQILFEYDERPSAEKSGNTWEGLPPSIALSPDYTRIAYSADDGLQLYDLSMGVSTPLMSVTSDSGGLDENGIEVPPTWSIEMDDWTTYWISYPRWSYDGQYVSFLRAHYEGATLGVLNVDTLDFHSPGSIGAYVTQSWSPAENAYLLPEGTGYSQQGLWYSLAPFSEVANLAESLDSSREYHEAAFSPDGGQIAFIYSSYENPDPAEPSLAIMNTDTSGYADITAEAGLQSPFYAPSGLDVYFISSTDGTYVLKKYSAESGDVQTLFTLPEGYNSWRFGSWSDEGYLIITGVSQESTGWYAGDVSQLFVIDVDNQKVVAQSDRFEQFVTFAGFIE